MELVPTFNGRTVDVRRLTAAQAGFIEPHSKPLPAAGALAHLRTLDLPATPEVEATLRAHFIGMSKAIVEDGDLVSMVLALAPAPASASASSPLPPPTQKEAAAAASAAKDEDEDKDEEDDAAVVTWFTATFEHGLSPKHVVSIMALYLEFKATAAGKAWGWRIQQFTPAIEALGVKKLPHGIRVDGRRVTALVGVRRRAAAEVLGLELSAGAAAAADDDAQHDHHMYDEGASSEESEEDEEEEGTSSGEESGEEESEAETVTAALKEKDAMFGFAATGHLDRYDASLVPTSRIAVDANLAIVSAGPLGRGVVATAAIPKGTKLGWYAGAAMWRDAGIALHPYGVDLNDNETIVGSPFHWASYVNDAQGTAAKPNVQYAFRPRGDGSEWVAIVTTRALAAGEQLYTSYEQRYWDACSQRDAFFAALRELAQQTPRLGLVAIRRGVRARAGVGPFCMTPWRPLVALVRKLADADGGGGGGAGGAGDAMDDAAIEGTEDAGTEEEEEEETSAASLEEDVDATAVAWFKQMYDIGVKGKGHAVQCTAVWNNFRDSAAYTARHHYRQFSAAILALGVERVRESSAGRPTVFVGVRRKVAAHVVTAGAGVKRVRGRGRATGGTPKRPKREYTDYGGDTGTDTDTDTDTSTEGTGEDEDVSEDVPEDGATEHDLVESDGETGTTESSGSTGNTDSVDAAAPAMVVASGGAGSGAGASVGAPVATHQRHMVELASWPHATLCMPTALLSAYGAYDSPFTPAAGTTCMVTLAGNLGASIHVRTEPTPIVGLHGSTVEVRLAADARSMRITELVGHCAVILRQRDDVAASIPLLPHTARSRAAKSTAMTTLELTAECLGPHQTAELRNGDILAFPPQPVTKADALLQTRRFASWYMMRIPQVAGAEGSHPQDPASRFPRPAVVKLAAIVAAEEAERAELKRAELELERAELERAEEAKRANAKEKAVIDAAAAAAAACTTTALSELVNTAGAAAGATTPLAEAAVAPPSSAATTAEESVSPPAAAAGEEMYAVRPLAPLGYGGADAALASAYVHNMTANWLWPT